MAQSILVATEFYRPLPQPHEPWTPTYCGLLAYKMTRGEAVPLWFKVNSDGPTSLALSGADAADFTAEFFKPFGQQVDNSDAFKRASLAASPLGTYYDPLNPIPSGTSNFTPEVPSGDEFVYLLLTCKSTAATGSKTIAVTLGSASVAITIHVWANVALPATPSRQLLLNVTSGSANQGVNGGYVSDAKTVAATEAVTDLLVKYRTTPYMNGVAFLPVASGKLDVDYLSTANESYRQMFLNRVPAGAFKFWMAMPETQASHRTLAYAQAAEAAISANGLTNMAVYVWDEPDTSTATATAIKGILDNWKNGSPSTKLVLTTTVDWFTTAGPAAAGLHLADYGTQIILVPVINQVGGSFTAITGYSNSQFGFYSSCQGNCGPSENSNASSGSDTGIVDFAYIDYPMVRRYAAYWLSMRSSWADKTAILLHYDSTQAWNSFRGTTSNDSQNPWLSARRFNIMGDGTFVYPAIPGYQPHVGIPAFTTGSPQATPSIRLLYLAHASYMADLLQLYLTAQSSHQADNLVTSQSSFSTTYQDYESLRDKLGNALEAGTTVSGSSDPIETVPPTVTTPTPDPTPPPAPVTPPPDPSNPVPPTPTPDPVAPPPLPPPPVIPQPPSPPSTPVAGGNSGSPAPDLVNAVPSIIDSPSGLVSVIDVGAGQSYVALMNTLYKFPRFAAQFSIGVESNGYLQSKVATRLSNKVLQIDANLWPLPPPSSALVDFFDTGSTAANYGNGTLTRTLNGGATIAGGVLIAEGTGLVNNRGAKYSAPAGLIPLVQTGTIRFLAIQSSIGNSHDSMLFYARNASGSSLANALFLVRKASGNILEFKVYDSAGVSSITATSAALGFSNGGDPILIEATFDLNQGLVEIWQNGVFVARSLGATNLTRSNAIAYAGVGADSTTTSYPNHTANLRCAGLSLFTTYRAWNKWEMMGIPVGERLNLSAYNISYGLMSDEQDAYHGAGSSSGGANL